MTNWLLYGVTVLIWGSTWFVIRFQLGVVPPELSVAYRFLAAGSLLMGYAILRGHRLAFGARDHVFLALQGLTLFCVNYVLFYYASFHFTTGLIAVLFSTMLWLNVANGALFLGIKVRARTVLGGGIGFAGMCVLFWPEMRDLDFGSARTVSLALALFATLSASWGNILSARNQRAGISVLASNGMAMAYGGALTLAFALARGHEPVFDLSTPYIASFAFLVLLGSIVAFGSYLTLLGRIGADRAAYAMVLFPVIALAVSTVFEGYRWTASGLAGAGLVMAGNLVVLGRARPAP